MVKLAILLSNTARLRTLVPGFSPSVNCTLLWHLAKVGSSFVFRFMCQARTRDDILLQNIASQLVQSESRLTPVDSVSAVYGLCKFHFNDDSGRTLGILTSRIRRNLSSYSLSDLSQVISSLARVGVCNKPLVSDIASRISPSELQDLSNQSLSNLMTGLARFGAKSSSKNPVWDILAEEVIRRMEANSSWLVPDVLATLLAYSSASHTNRELTDRFFSTVSQYLLSDSIILDQDSVSKYLKACSRVEFRDIELLSKCASSLRQLPEFFPQSDTRDLLQIYTNLDKLGVDMKDLEDELRRRNITIPFSRPSTWFPQSQKRANLSSDKRTRPQTSDPLRKRKYSW